MVAHSTLPTKTRPPIPEDGPLMARLRVADALRLCLGGGAEDGDQRRVKSLLDTMGLLWQHTPSEGKRNKAERGAALARGLKRSVPDVLIYRPFVAEGVSYSGLAIELKRTDATPCAVKDEQRGWLRDLRGCGWMAEWCRGYQEAAALIRAAYGQGGR